MTCLFFTIITDVYKMRLLEGEEGGEKGGIAPRERNWWDFGRF